MIDGWTDEWWADIQKEDVWVPEETSQVVCYVEALRKRLEAAEAAIAMYGKHAANVHECDEQGAKQ